MYRETESVWVSIGFSRTNASFSTSECDSP